MPNPPYYPEKTPRFGANMITVQDAVDLFETILYETAKHWDWASRPFHSIDWLKQQAHHNEFFSGFPLPLFDHERTRRDDWTMEAIEWPENYDFPEPDQVIESDPAMNSSCFVGGAFAIVQSGRQAMQEIKEAILPKTRGRKYGKVRTRNLSSGHAPRRPKRTRKKKAPPI